MSSSSSSSSSLQLTYSRRPSLSCHLFFRSTTEESRARLRDSWRIPDHVVEAINKDFALPFQVPLDSDTDAATTPQQQGTAITIRLVESKDVKAIVDMCVEEYGSGPRTFPWSEPWKIVEWYDLVALQQLVEITTRLKLTSNSIPLDHAIIVVVVSLNNDKEEPIAMIEVSRQPVEPNKNPSPIPVPLIVKKVYCQLFGLNEPPQGWITNLLVTPQYRGKGISKLLVASAEGIARQWWNCQSIHLHCDANTQSGRIPQRLYLSMGYKTLLRDHSTTSAAAAMPLDLSWIVSEVTLQTGVFFIDGVPLLYLKKDL